MAERAGAAPRVECERHHASICVDDVQEAVAFYTEKLGFELGFTWGEPPTMAGVTLGEVQQFLQQGTPNPAGCGLYFVVGDADELYEYHRSNGVEVTMEPGDREYELRDYSVRDLHGYTLTFGHPIFTVGPAVEVERVDLTVRLEKRLAALLEELAEHQGREPGEGAGRDARGDPAPHERRRDAPHEGHAEVHPGAEGEARDRLRHPRELPVRGGVREEST